MGKRINIVLPEMTVRTIDRMTKPCQRSRFIDQAVRHYVANQSIEALRARLERAAVRDQDLDREVAADWFAVDHETCRQLDGVTPGESRLPQAGEIYLTALDPTLGREIQRPAPL